MADSIQATKEGLKIVDQKRTVKGWTKTTITWLDEAGKIGKSTLERFWQGKPIRQENFVAICKAVGIDDWKSIADLTILTVTPQFQSKPPEPNIYNPQTWVGRESLIKEILTKFDLNTRIVWLTGLSGIGKTILGECLAVKAWEKNPSFHWVHLEIFEGQLPDFATSAAKILETLGERDIDPQNRNNAQWMCDRLLLKLESNPYWLQIDALEKLLNPEKSNDFDDNYWLSFLQQCLTRPNFASRLLLTSQALPNGLIDWCDRYCNIWHQERLKGLENDESWQYFAKNGIDVNEANQAILSRIGQIYEGHPLVLQVITGEIVRDYQGNVAQYWQDNQEEFEQVGRELKLKHLTESEYNEELDRRVRERVKKSLQQLPNDAIALLRRSSVYRRPVPKSFWLGMMAEYSVEQQKKVYRILSDRALIEKEQSLIRQHNLIRDIAYNWLREDETIWKETERKAADFWLNEYKPAEDVENIEKVRGYLEAFYHYCEIGDFEKAVQLINIPINYSDQDLYSSESLHNCLRMCGYPNEQINMYKSLDKKENLNQNLRLNMKLGISNVYWDLGDSEQAIKILTECCKNIDKYEPVYQCMVIDSLCLHLGQSNSDLELIISLNQRSLSIASKINDKYFECCSLHSIGCAYLGLGNYCEAINFLERAYNIAKEFTSIIQVSFLSKITRNLAWLYARCDRKQESITKMEESAELVDKLDDKVAQAELLEITPSIARNIYGCRKSYNYLKELNFYKDALSIYNTLENKNFNQQSDIILKMTKILIECRDYNQALTHCLQAYEIINKETHNLEQKEECLLLLGNINMKLKNYKDAIKYNREHINMIKKNQLQQFREHRESTLEKARELTIPLIKHCEELLLEIEKGEEINA